VVVTNYEIYRLSGKKIDVLSVNFNTWNLYCSMTAVRLLVTVIFGAEIGARARGPSCTTYLTVAVIVSNIWATTVFDRKVEVIIIVSNELNYLQGGWY
jgi:hypothetical protein